MIPILRLTPEDPDQFEQETLALARIPVVVDDSDYDLVQAAILDGFAENFRSEASALGAWPQLASLTRSEREAQGYPPAHPILVRSGSYRDSWLSERHPLHIHDVSKSGGDVSITEGSKDPRVPVLSAGATFGSFGIPPRPVEALQEAAFEPIAEAVIEVIEIGADDIPRQ